jgi:hypothetical protein
MAMVYLKASGNDDYLQNHALTGIKEKKRCLGLLSHKCPVCDAKTRYFYPIAKIRDPNNNSHLVGKDLLIPSVTKESEWKNVPLFGKQLINGVPFDSIGCDSRIRFSECVNGHQTAKVDVLYYPGSAEVTYLVKDGALEVFRIEDTSPNVD